MSQKFDIGDRGSAEQFPPRFRIDSARNNASAVGAPLRSAFDDDRAESEPVPEEFFSLLEMLH
ncbi:hypothetical protein [Parasphingopyxis marina]|uniref:Uncharacterized protein n=1 Tax=Parasphingopyxis marina TaxID=2761622 RepID=A0A842HV77_9SPHN|nr:hypothetical protein [Parasphingopyxis marina]MBC2776986.1 hypothetical protein [Parasphingopyxis marina]